MQCTGAAKSGVLRWTITRRGPVIADGIQVEELSLRLQLGGPFDALYSTVFNYSAGTCDRDPVRSTQD